jgi:hypothetical protein
MFMMLHPPEVLHSGLRNKEEVQHIDVELPVRVLERNCVNYSSLGSGVVVGNTSGQANSDCSHLLVSEG